MTRRQIFLLMLLVGACGRKTSTIVKEVAVPDNSELKVPSKTTGVTFVPATVLDCPNGGTRVVTFDDANFNGLLDNDETTLSSVPICNGSNGSNGSNGQDGIGAGIIVDTASLAACSAGGSVFKTFSDLNNNTILDGAESISTQTTICNGVAGQNGSDGQSAYLTTTAASALQCSNGGVVYTSSVTGQVSPDVTVVCNGINGQDAAFSMGPVGSPVLNKSYSACHHDYLYIPNSSNPDRGWLTFRHQGNGASDQGIGSTGFQIWNVDIGNFSLASEVGNVTYCNLNWNAQTRTLNYTVVDSTDGLQGQTGQIGF